MAQRITSQLKQRVLDMLSNYPMLRDNDHRLITNMWHQELPDHLKKDKGVREFFQLLSIGYFTAGDSITRARRQIQEANPSLRGNKHAARQSHTKTIQQDLGYNTD